MREKTKLTKRIIIDIVNMIMAALTMSMSAYYFASGKPLDAAALLSVGLLNAFIFFWHPEGYDELTAN